MSRPDIAQTVRSLDAISGDDPESAHVDADAAVLAHVHWSILEAYERVTERCDWWGHGWYA